MMTSLARVSKALDSGDIGEVQTALFSLPDDVENCDDSFVIFLHELTTWDLSKSPETSYSTIQRLMGLIQSQKKLQQSCERILMKQTPLAVQVAAEIMIRNGWTLSEDDCNEVWKNIESSGTSEEFANRMAANCAILRLSKTPKRFLSKLLLETASTLNSFPFDFLNELSMLHPFHPLLVIQDFPFIPRLFSPSYKSSLEIEEFTIFLNSNKSFVQSHARQFFQVAKQICSRMDRLEAEDIDKISEFWFATLRVLSGEGIQMEDNYEAAKLQFQTTEKFEMSRRPLFLKRLLRKFVETKDSNISLEPHFVANILTIFQRMATSSQSTEFFEELGDFWTLCSEIKYDDVFYANVYFSSVFSLARAQALNRKKKELCRAVYERILKPLHGQISDFLRIKNMETGKRSGQEERLLMEQQDLGADSLGILECTYKLAEQAVLEFISP